MADSGRAGQKRPATPGGDVGFVAQLGAVPSLQLPARRPLRSTLSERDLKVDTSGSQSPRLGQPTPFPPKTEVRAMPVSSSHLRRGSRGSSANDVRRPRPSDVPFFFLNEERHQNAIAPAAPLRSDGAGPSREEMRLKTRVKTSRAGLVICLNVGVPPPDIIAPYPCAVLECWLDPTEIPSPEKAVEAVSQSLQAQYQTMQPSLTFMEALDPTLDRVKKMCILLRRKAKDQSRLLFHYNGHGAPRPTARGEIWLFNKDFSKYCPAFVANILQWLDGPSLLVFDCNNAGRLVEHLLELESKQVEQGKANPLDDVLVMASCGPEEELPFLPANMPADIFTACLTTPLRIALFWFLHHGDYSLAFGGKDAPPSFDLDRIPGVPGDRTTILGQLNWVFSAVTDCIAWSVLSPTLYQRLYTEDELVAGLYRNFLLAERILRSGARTPVSIPRIPPTYNHPMWRAWDYALDCIITALSDPACDTVDSIPFFPEQLQSFELWLDMQTSTGKSSGDRSAPPQLPAILHAILGNKYRKRALALTGRFFMLGPWAVEFGVQVGMLYYLRQLLHINTTSQHDLAVIWSRILAYDKTNNTQLIREDRHFFYFRILSSPQNAPNSPTTLDCILAMFSLMQLMDGHPAGQQKCIAGKDGESLMDLLLLHLDSTHSLLLRWTCICAGKMWENWPDALPRSTPGVLQRLEQLVSHDVPEVRAAALFAIGTYQMAGRAFDPSVGAAELFAECAADASPVVRRELVFALHRYLAANEAAFGVYIHSLPSPIPLPTVEPPPPTTTAARAPATPSAASLSSPVKSGAPGTPSASGRASVPASPHTADGTFPAVPTIHSPLRAPAPAPATGPHRSFEIVYHAVQFLARDPFTKVRTAARSLLLRYTRDNRSVRAAPEVSSSSAGSSPGPSPNPMENTAPLSSSPGTPGSPRMSLSAGTDQGPLSMEASKPLPMKEARGTRPTFDAAGPRSPQSSRTDSSRGGAPGPSEADSEDTEYTLSNIVPWAMHYFLSEVERLENQESGQPAPQRNYVGDTYADTLAKAEWRVRRNKLSQRNWEALRDRLSNKLATIDNGADPVEVMLFHPFEPYILIASARRISVWDWLEARCTYMFANMNAPGTRICSMLFINGAALDMLLVCSDDGGVWVWREPCSPNPVLATAWRVPDPEPKNSNAPVVVRWQQESGLLYMCRGSSVSVWDLETEMRVRVFDVGGGDPVAITCCACGLSELGATLVLGCDDGSVRSVDMNAAPTEANVTVFTGHRGPILGAVLFPKIMTTVDPPPLPTPPPREDLSDGGYSESEDGMSPHISPRGGGGISPRGGVSPRGVSPRIDSPRKVKAAPRQFPKAMSSTGTFLPGWADSAKDTPMPTIRRNPSYTALDRAGAESPLPLPTPATPGALPRAPSSTSVGDSLLSFIGDFVPFVQSPRRSRANSDPPEMAPWVAAADLITVCASGEVHFWDFRSQRCLHSVTVNDSGLTAFAAHPQRALFAASHGTAQSRMVKIFDGQGRVLDKIKRSDGMKIMGGSRTGPITAMIFHPNEAVLATASGATVTLSGEKPR